MVKREVNNVIILKTNTDEYLKSIKRLGYLDLKELLLGYMANYIYKEKNQIVIELSSYLNLVKNNDKYRTASNIIPEFEESISSLKLVAKNIDKIHLDCLLGESVILLQVKIKYIEGRKK